MMSAASSVVFVATRRMQDLTAAEAAAANRMTGFLADVMTNIAAVKAAGAEPDEREAASEVAAGRARDLEVMRSFLKFSAGYASVITIINTGAVPRPSSPRTAVPSVARSTSLSPTR